MKKQLCRFRCLAKHMCFQMAGQGWNSPALQQSSPGSEQPAWAHSPVVSTHCNQPGLLHSLGSGLKLLKAASPPLHYQSYVLWPLPDV